MYTLKVQLKALSQYTNNDLKLNFTIRSTLFNLVKVTST